MASDSIRKPICVDLFCGAGGLSEGLRLAGYNSVMAVDLDGNSLETYQYNHPNTRVINADISGLSGAAIIDACEGEELDLLAGGPSCQGFSTHGKRDADDPRNFLFKQFIRIAEETQPKWVLIENVQGLLTYSKGYFRDLIVNELAAIGYQTRAQLVNAVDYGVPQRRKRIFFIGNRIGSPITFPEPTHGMFRGQKSFVTIGDAIGDLPLMNGEFNQNAWDYVSPPTCDFQRYARQFSPTLTLHQANGMSEQARNVAQYIGEGEGLRAVPVEHLPERFKRMRRISSGELRKDCTTLYYRLDRTQPGYTITCYFRNVASGPFMHPLEDRSISMREAARIMSFQDRYRFLGTGIPRQIGNAVPPLLARAMGRHILACDCAVANTIADSHFALV